MHRYYKTTVSIQKNPAVSNVMLQREAAFKKLQKVTTIFVIPVSPTQLPLNRFSGNLIFEYFLKIC
jgi:hypothetical protein